MKSKNSFTLLAGMLPALRTTLPGMLVAASTWVQAAETEIIPLQTDHFRVVYAVRGTRELELKEVAARDASWRAPLRGLLFPARSLDAYGNSPADRDPVALRKPNGDSSVDWIHESHTATQPAPGVEHVTIFLRDRHDLLGLELHFRVHAREDVIEQWMVLSNGMDGPVTVEHLDSATWQGSAGNGVFLEWYDSRWGKEALRPQQERLARGRRAISGYDGNRHILGPVPAFVLGFGQLPDEDSVPCLVASLAWSGSTRMEFEVNNRDGLQVGIGVITLKYRVCHPRLFMDLPS